MMQELVSEAVSFLHKRRNLYCQISWPGTFRDLGDLVYWYVGRQLENGLRG